MILAVDTSLGTSVAVIDPDGRVIADAASANSLGHAEVIGDLLARVAVPGITHVVAGMGPGPFTGLRIGIAAARAFAVGRDIPVIPVPSHFAVARTALDAGTTRFAVVTDARRREVAVSEFEGEDADGIPHLIAPTRLEKQGAAPELSAIVATELDAAALARVGIAAHRAERVLAGAEPLYLRHPDVAQPSAPKKVSG